MKYVYTYRNMSQPLKLYYRYLKEFDGHNTIDELM